MFANNQRVVNKVLAAEHQLLNAWRVASLAVNMYSFSPLLSFMSILNRFCYTMQWITPRAYGYEYGLLDLLSLIMLQWY